jgi:hypothetical protein
MSSDQNAAHRTSRKDLRGLTVAGPSGSGFGALTVRSTHERCALLLSSMIAESKNQQVLKLTRRIVYTLKCAERHFLSHSNSPPNP